MNRFAMSLPVSVKELSSGLVKESRTRDISSHGAYLITRRPMGVGTMVSVALGLSNTDSSPSPRRHHAWVDVKGVVLRTDPGGMAITFMPNYRIRGKGN